MSAIVELRAATWSCHQRLEKRLDIPLRIQTSSAYRAHLERMWGFYAAAESRPCSGAFRGALPDYDARRKAPLLARDLSALGADGTAIERLPLCDPLPVCEDAAAEFGRAYVLEGATLGGRSLLPLVQRRLGLTAERGAAFFASYGDRINAMWRAFADALDRYCAKPEQGSRAAIAANETFLALETWLCGSHS